MFVEPDSSRDSPRVCISAEYLEFVILSSSESILLILFETPCLAYLGDKKSTSSIDMRPKLLLKKYLKYIAILFIHCIHDSLIFEEIE